MFVLFYAKCIWELTGDV